MCDPDTFLATGELVKHGGEGHFWVQMRNGCELFGFLPKKQKLLLSDLRLGDMVSVSLSPADMGKGRIVAKEN